MQPITSTTDTTTKARGKRVTPRGLASIGGLVILGSYLLMALTLVLAKSYTGGTIELAIRANAGDGQAQAIVLISQLAQFALVLGIIALAAAAAWAIVRRIGR